MPKDMIVFLVTAIIAVVVHYFSFKMRYGWYTSNEEAMFLNAGFLIFLVGIVLLWVLFPTRIGVAILGIATIMFPWLIRPETFPRIDTAREECFSENLAQPHR